MSLEEAGIIADELMEVFKKTHRWRPDAKTKMMMDFYNKEYAHLPGNRAYSMNCTPCIGNVVFYIRKVRLAQTSEPATNHIAS